MHGADMRSSGRRRVRDIGASPLGIELLEDATMPSLALRVAGRVATTSTNVARASGATGTKSRNGS